MIIMLYRDVVNLISTTEVEDSDGYLTSTETSTEVFANVKSVSRSEFYASYQVGINMTISFEIRACDYNNQKIIEYDGKRYSVQRTFTKNGEILELNCSDLAV